MRTNAMRPLNQRMNMDLLQQRCAQPLWAGMHDV
jgi:hypothetical protein